MKLSKTELKMLKSISKKNKVDGIATALSISKSQAYRVIRKLGDKGFITIDKEGIRPTLKTHTNLLLKILNEFDSLIAPFSGAGLKIYTELTEPRTINEIKERTGLQKAIIFKKLRQGKKISLIVHKKAGYEINKKIWKDANEFLVELKRYEENIDPRVPVNSSIYMKKEDEIIFSSKEQIDAEPTAFSAYGKHGIKIFLNKNYYYLPKKKLSRKNIFRHSLDIINKEHKIRYIIFVALFYIKFKKELSKVHHRVLEDIKRVLKGERIPNFPTLDEIKDRAEVYNIEVKA